MRPEVPLSSRWTMPGRSGSPTERISGYRASSPWTSVPPRWPAPGWTTMPAGLSTTSRSASSNPTGTTTDGSGGSGWVSRGSGASNSSTSPSATRCERLVTARPPTATAPASTSPAACDRLHPATMATTRSSRWPSSARGVGHVEHRPPLQVDEVDHPAAQEPLAGAERPVHEVAHCAPGHEADGDGRTGMGGVTARPQQYGPHDQGEQRYDRAPPLGEAERRAVIDGEVQPECPHDVDRPGRQRLDRPPLGELVDGEHGGRDPEEQRPAGRRRSGGGRPGRRGAPPGPRARPPTPPFP